MCALPVVTVWVFAVAVNPPLGLALLFLFLPADRRDEAVDDVAVPTASASDYGDMQPVKA